MPGPDVLGARFWGRPRRLMALAISSDITREDAMQALSTATEDQRAAAIYELAQRGEAELAEYLDMIVNMLGSSADTGVKTAVCQAVRSAGSQGYYYVQSIESLLSDTDSDVKYEACLTLANMGSYADGAKSSIKPLLREQKEIVRFGACLALGSIEARECTESVAELLSDPSPEVQGAACMSLGKLGCSSRAAEVAEKLEEPRSRLQAIYALGLMEEEGAKHCEKVCDCLEDDDSETRIAAAQMVGQMAEAVKDNSSAMGKAVALLTAEDGRFRTTAALALGYMGAHAVDQVDMLQEALSDEFQEPACNALTAGGARSKLPPSCRKTKCAAAAALGMIVAAGGDAQSEMVASGIGSLLNDDDWETRMAACEALALMGDKAKELGSQVATLFDDEKFAVRAKAAYCCGKLGDTDVCSSLADLVGDKCPSVKEEAMLALAELGDEGTEFIEKVFEKVMDYSPTVRAAAVQALGKMGEKGQLYAGAIAQRLLNFEAPNVKIAALEALGNMEDHGCAYADVIADYLNDPVPNIRAAAATSLGKLGGSEVEAFHGAIRALADDPDTEVAKAANVAITTLDI